MDVRLTLEQQALRDAAAQVVDRLGPQAVGQLDDAERTAKLEAAVVTSGWRELRLPEEDGAPLASGVEVAIVAEELGRGLGDVALVGPTLAVELRRLAGAPAAPESEPETVALDPTLAALATVGTAGRVVPGAVAIDAAGATHALLLVPSPSGSVLARAALGAPIVRTDLTRPVAELAPTSGGPVPVERADGTPAALDPDALASWTALGLALTSADLVGTMRGAIDLTVAYAVSREQFGKAIGSFQAVQHLLADAFVLMEGSRSVARHAAWAVDALPPTDAQAAAELAKAYCARSARTVGETAIQVHGGIGNTWECLAHVHLRRALVSSEVLGGAAASLERVLRHHGLTADVIEGAA